MILPKYTCMKQEMKDKLTYKTHFYMDFHWKEEYVGILEAEVEGVKYYFIDNGISIADRRNRVRIYKTAL